jgi:hypothetical protein
MFRRTCLALALLGLAGCNLPPPVLSRGAPAPPPRRATPVSLSQRVQQEGWMTRFWEQLTPAQKRRVLARLRAGDPPHATSEAEAAPVWDALGLPDRDALVFGGGLPGRGS